MNESPFKYGYKYSGSIIDGNFSIYERLTGVKLLRGFISLVVVAPVFIIVTIIVIFVVEICYYLAGS
jgi:hypothetical protein